MSKSIYSPKTKQCSKCKEIKSFNDFSKKKSNKDGLQYNCKKCISQYYINNKTSIDKQHAQYYINNKEQRHQYYIVFRQYLYFLFPEFFS